MVIENQPKSGDSNVPGEAQQKLDVTLREPVIYVLADFVPLTENQCGKTKVFFLSGKGGYPPP